MINKEIVYIMYRQIAKLLTIIAATVFFTSFSMFTANANGGTSISIPAIGVNAPIVTIGIRAFPDGSVTWDTTNLTTQVGYLDGTSWFGEGGNVVLGGHSELAERAPSVFYNLDDLNVGDEIVVTVNGTQHRYTVTRKFDVATSDLSIVYPTNNEQLTIMTCDIDSYVNGTYARRTVIVAVPA